MLTPHRHSRLRSALLPGASLALVALAAAIVTPAATAAADRRGPIPRITAIATSADGSRSGTPLKPVGGWSTVTVTVDTSAPAQEWYGVGGALTDASVSLLRGNTTAVRALFDPADPNGAHLNLVRLPLSSTDFSPTLWTWDWDGERAHPSAEARAAVDLLVSEIAPLVGDTLAVNAVAWSAPAAMKTTDTLRGGALRRDAETAYGDMLVSQVSTLLGAGVPVRWLSLGNEPGHTADYTTMTMTTDQQARLARAVATNGPRDLGSAQGCSTCRGLGRLTPQGGSLEPEFFVAAHLARAAVPGSRYLPVSVSNGSVTAAAFRHPDGTVGIYAHNGSSFARTIRFTDRRGAALSYRVPAGDLITVTVA